MEAIRAIRNIRAEAGATPSKKFAATIVAEEKVLDGFKEEENSIKDLAGLTELILSSSKEGLSKDAMTSVISGAEIFVPMEELIDFKAEMERLTKEKKRLEGEVKRAEGKLSNEGFVGKAPANLIEEEKKKLADYKEMLSKVDERINSIQEKL